MTNKPMLSVERDLIERAIQAIINTSQMQPALNELRALLDAEKVNNREMGLMQYVDAHPIKPSAQQQGYPVAVGRVSYIGNGFVRVRLNGSAPLLESPLYAKQPAPVAVVLPFAEKVIAKLQRFEACVSDGQDVDIDRHWFDVLTQLGLLNRVQRSPAYWEMTQQGEDALEATRLNSPQ